MAIKFPPGTVFRYVKEDYSAIGMVTNYYNQSSVTSLMDHWYQVKWFYCTKKIDLPILVRGMEIDENSKEDEAARLFYTQE